MDAGGNGTSHQVSSRGCGVRTRCLGGAVEHPTQLEAGGGRYEVVVRLPFGKDSCGAETFAGSGAMRHEEHVWSGNMMTVPQRREIMVCEKLAKVFLAGVRSNILGGHLQLPGALTLLQVCVCVCVRVKVTKTTRNSQIMKIMRFVKEVGRGMPRGEIDLAACTTWLLNEGAVAAKSFRQYLWAILHFCEGEKRSPLPPIPKKSA